MVFEKRSKEVRERGSCHGDTGRKEIQDKDEHVPLSETGNYVLLCLRNHCGLALGKEEE